MDHATSQSDEALARASLAGRREAFEELVKRYLRPAMALASHLTRSREDAEDVVQESFHRAVRALGQYDDSRPFSPWFFSIVRNVARSSLEKGRRRLELVPVTSLDSDAREAAHAATNATKTLARHDLVTAISRLTPMRRACIELCEIEGATSVEAADMLGISEGTVRTHLHRARAQLRRLLEPEGSTCQSA